MYEETVTSKVTELQSLLHTKLQSTTKTKILEEITARIGSLSEPSKMPGYSWSISASLCQTGGILRKIEGTPCYACYACKGRYKFPTVQSALDKRYNAWLSDSDWINLMSIRLLLLGETYFRWFDSGDLQSIKMLDDIKQVAINTLGHVKHWLPTQERKILKGSIISIPENLVIRISSSRIDQIDTILYEGVLSSSIVTKFSTDDETNKHCPSSKQGGKCLDCRNCWDPNVQHVYYYKH